MSNRVSRVGREFASTSSVATDDLIPVFDISANETKNVTPPDLIAGAGVTSSVTELNQLDSSAQVGTVGTPSAGTITASEERNGNFMTTTLTLTGARVPVTDGTTDGSHGALEIYTLPEGAVGTLGSRQNYTAFSENGTISGGDTVFEIGVGSTSIAAAANGSLGATEDDIGGDVNVTLSGGAGTGTGLTGIAGPYDGTTTAQAVYLNWSGTAATVDQSGSIDVTGTITINWQFLGDD